MPQRVNARLRIRVGGVLLVAEIAAQQMPQPFVYAEVAGLALRGDQEAESLCAGQPRQRVLRALHEHRWWHVRPSVGGGRHVQRRRSAAQQPPEVRITLDVHRRRQQDQRVGPTLRNRLRAANRHRARGEMPARRDTVERNTRGIDAERIRMYAGPSQGGADVGDCLERSRGAVAQSILHRERLEATRGKCGCRGIHPARLSRGPAAAVQQQHGGSTRAVTTRRGEVVQSQRVAAYHRVRQQRPRRGRRDRRARRAASRRREHENPTQDVMRASHESSGAGGGWH